MKITGARAYELYGNLLSNEAPHPLKKIIKVQVKVALWEDLKRAVHQEKRTTRWDSFLECIMLHLLQMFRHDTGEAVKYYLQIH